MSDVAWIIIYICILVVCIVATWFIAIAYRKNIAEAKIGKAEVAAREIIDEAQKDAEAKKREILLEAKEDALKTRNDLEKEVKDRRGEISRMEKRVLAREESIDRKTEAIEKKEASLASKEGQLEKQKARVEELQAKRLQELERISGLTSEQAKEYLLKTVEDEVKHETAVMIKELETRAKEEADKKAKDYVVTAIQKCAVDHVSETTISLVQLPNDEMKGRIIGREGRNIKAIENATGVDLIIDDTPEVITLSCFDPIRREVARLSLETLIHDGRIQPGRIEEVVAKTKKDLDDTILKAGQDAVFELGLSKMNKELVMMIGKLKYRTSYGQNALQHSIEVAHFAGIMASELGLNQQLAKRAGLLHDLGKAVDHEMEGSHVELGAKFAKKFGENATVINAIESHHGDVPATSIIAVLISAADTLSAARPGSRSEKIENYIQRLEKLEELPKQFEGVDKVFAIQAGREIRVIVNPEKIDDLKAHKLARDVKEKIETELTYPGHIKVTVIREIRANEIAK
mgnify:CR=1 FL=1